MPPRSVLLAFFLSLLLHLVAILFIGRLWEERQAAEAFRVRLAYQPRFVPPLRLPSLGPAVPRVAMEYLPSEKIPPRVPESELALQVAPLSPDEEAVEPPALTTPEGPRPRPTVPGFAREALPSPSEWVTVDTLEREAMELLRIEDMARVDQGRAVVIPDLYSRRDVTGYVNFTLLLLDGAGSPAGGLDHLARYMRDHTRILAQVRHSLRPYFLSEQLLKDPIHFLSPGRRLGGRSSGRLTHLSPEELGLLGRYLREGGFLFVGPGTHPQADESQEDSSAAAPTAETGEAGSEEAALDPPERPNTPWLREMIVHVHDALSPDGRLFEIPPSHPLYHSFFDYDVGFPGERKTKMLDAPPPAWYFRKGEKDTPGLWGVELDGDLVAVFSELGLPDQALTNVVVYALTRPGGLTPRRARPAWESPRPEEPLDPGLADRGAPAEDDSELYDLAAASLALLHAPLGDPLGEGGLRLKVDDRHAVELLRSDIHGLLLYNLPAGRHWIELKYGRTGQRVEVELQGGKVTTATFRSNRVAFYRWMQVRVRAERLWVEDWRNRFSDLRLEELHFELEETAPPDQEPGL